MSVAELEWRPNASFATVASVQVEVTATSDGWRVRALAATREDHWGLLVVNTNPFVLRFPDGSCFEVGIGRPDADGRFDVWEWTACHKRQPACPTCGGSFDRTSIYDDSGQDLSGPVSVTDHCGACGKEHQATYYLHAATE